MVRFALAGFCLAVIATCPLAAYAQAAKAVTPNRYELVINGETFHVEGSRLLRLQSQARPGVNYDVMLRVAPTQVLRLNTVQFDYDYLAKVVDDRRPQNRSVSLTHELGFTIVLNDLGPPLPPAERDEALKILSDSILATFQAQKVADLEPETPQERRFATSSGRGRAIRYRDSQGLAHSCLVYALNGQEFGVSCIVTYLDRDFDQIKPLLLQTLNSLRPKK